MMPSPLLSSNPATSSTTRRKKKKKLQSQYVAENLRNEQDSVIQWKSDAQQQIYSSKLLQALRHVPNNSGSSAQKFASKRVREAADRVLATTARGRSRWSRAILTNRLKLSFTKKDNIIKRQQSVLTAITSGNSRSLKKPKVDILRLKSKSLPAVQRKARVLSRLVPGCRKQPLPVVLAEAADYIPALEMQVRVMSALAELLTVSGSSYTSNSAEGLNQQSSNQPPSC